MEKEIFKRGKINIDKLIKYGFKKDNNSYIYEKEILDNSFKIIVIYDGENIIGKVYDLFTNEEYINYKLKNNNGIFASKINLEYESLLIDIYNNCFDEQVFILEQANRINNYVIEKYNIEPAFLWDSNPGFGVYKNSNNKWFGIIMNINWDKIDKDKKGDVEIINLKADNDIPKLLEIKGIYSAYHMNKKYWISIVLDNTLSDKEVEKLIDISYKLVNKK